MLRLARTLFVAVPSITLSAAAHTSGHGCVTVAGAALTALIVGTSTWTQLSRERSRAFLLGWLVVTQVLGHGLLAVSCTGSAAHESGTSLRMLELHGAAVVVCAVLLSGAERRVWAFARLLATLQARLRQYVGRLVPSYQQSLPVLDSTAGPSPEPTACPASPWCSPRPVRRGPPRLALSLA
jgi:hypothetical protein